MIEIERKSFLCGLRRKSRGEAVVTLIPRENATESAHEFDEENKTLAITERGPGQGRPLSALDYLYDEAGNRTATLASVDADGRGAKEETLDTYYYDETYQVTGADYGARVGPVSDRISAPAATVRFTYDAVGNRVQVDENGAVTRYSVNSLNNEARERGDGEQRSCESAGRLAWVPPGQRKAQYTQVGEFIPTHDRNGNLSGMGQWLYRYDAMNRLVFASNGTMTARFWYDAKNRCVAQSYPSNETTG